MLTKEQIDYIEHAVRETIAKEKGPRSLMRPSFHEYSQMYVFATENLRGYLSKLDVSGTDVLTVTGSGDQLINLALLGAKKVDCFDINRNAEFMTELKIAALKTLSYGEYLEFFSSHETEELQGLGFQKAVKPNDKAFSYDVFNRIRQNMPEMHSLYWNKLYELNNYDGRALSSKYCFAMSRESGINNNIYLSNESEYSKTVSKINDIEYSFHYKDALKLHELPSKYDHILLSNIYTYITDEWYAVMNKEEFNNYIGSVLSTRLKPNGKITMAYQYNYKEKNTVSIKGLKKLFQNKYKINANDALANFAHKVITFPSVTKEYRAAGDEDAVYIYDSAKVK